MNEEPINIDLSAQQLKVVKDLLCAYLPHTEVWAYGSRVKGTAKRYSDLDLVAFIKPEQKAALAGLREAFEDSNLPFRVDLFGWNEVPEQFHKNIKKEKVVMQAANKDCNLGVGWAEPSEAQSAEGVGGDVGLPDVSPIYKTKPFGELFEIALRNGLTKPKNVRGAGYKMVNMGELFAFPRIKNVLMDRVPLSEKEKDTSMLEDGDLLFARQSLVRDGAGECSIFIYDDEQVCFESHLIRCRLNKEIANPLFYYYFFRCKQGKQTIDAIIEQGAGAAGIRGSDLAKLQVPYIEKEIQDEIAAQLNALDEKIELNRQINQTLEQIAQAIFKSWFVDFDPVKAKIAAKQNGEDPERAAMRAISSLTDAELDQLSPEQFQQLRSTAALFPDKLINSDLGDIPVEWRGNTIDDVVSHIIDHRGKTPKKLGGDWSNEGFPAISAKNIKNGRIVNHEDIRYVDEELYHRWMKDELDVGDILITSEGPMGEMYFLSTNEKYCLSQRLYGIRADRKNTTPVYLYFWLGSTQAKSDLEGRATGTTVVGIRQSELRKVKVLSPPISLLNVFEAVTKPLLDNLYLKEKETLNLVEVRDSFLPRLLSGEIVFGKMESVGE